MMANRPDVQVYVWAGNKQTSETNTIKIYHYRFRVNGRIIPHGGMTIAYEPETGRAAMALCSLKDQFNRKIGHYIALNRLEDGQVIHLSPRLKDAEKVYIHAAETFVTGRNTTYSTLRSPWVQTVYRAAQVVGKPFELVCSNNGKATVVDVFNPMKKPKQWRSWNKTVRVLA